MGTRLQGQESVVHLRPQEEDSQDRDPTRAAGVQLILRTAMYLVFPKGKRPGDEESPSLAVFQAGDPETELQRTDCCSLDVGAVQGPARRCAVKVVDSTGDTRGETARTSLGRTG